jgi:hypothetical protein
MQKNLLFAMNFIGTIGFSTAIPLVFFAFLGRYLDRRFDTDPYLFLSGIFFATILVFFILKKTVNRMMKEYEILNK